MLVGVRQRLLASTRRGVPFLFAQGEGLGAQLVLNLNLLETLARRVVLMLGRFAGELQRPLPHSVGEVGDLRRHPGEGRRVPFDADA
jgi:hypothetical protein